MKIQLIIPMTGVGQRFIDAGYEKLKPLILIEERAMIDWVMDMYKNITDPIFILSNSHPQAEMLKLHLEESWPQAYCYFIEPHKMGPSYAVWMIRKHLDLSLPTIVNYCDFSGDWDLQGLIKTLETNDGSILTYTGFHPHMIRNSRFAYVKKGINGNVIDIQEKQPYTSSPMDEEASAGTYGFRNAKLMIEAIETQLNSDLNLNGEYYTSLTFLPLIEAGCKIRTFPMKKFYQWGTPEDLADWLYWRKAIRRLSNSENINQKSLYEGNAIILAAGNGARLKDYDEKSKPLIGILDKQLWEFSLDASRALKNKPLLVTKDKDFFDQKPGDVNLKILDKPTQGQAETALIGIRSLEETGEYNKPLHIFSCDNIIPNNELSKIEKIVHEYDVIFWSAKNYPPALLKQESYSRIDVKDGIVLRTSMKSPGTDFINPQIIIGNFSFKSLNIAKELIEELMNLNLKVKNEYYLDSIIELAFIRGLKVANNTVDDFVAIGTPEEYKSFKYFADLKY